MFKSLFSNESVKKKILASFIDEYKKQGIKQILIQLNEKDEIDLQVVTGDKIIADKNTYLFLMEFYNQNKKITNGI